MSRYGYMYVWLQVDHRYIYIYIYIYIYMYVYEYAYSFRGHECVCLAICILHVNNSSSIRGHGQIKLSRNFKKFNFIVTFLGCSGDILSGNIFMSSIWVGKRPEVENIHPCIYTNLVRESDESEIHSQSAGHPQELGWSARIWQGRIHARCKGGGQSQRKFQGDIHPSICG